MMGGEQMDKPFRWNSKGVTLIELLVVLVICTMLIGGIYRLFISQTRAYTVQDQVVEVQQNTRAAMEILLRDLRMAGYDNDTTAGVRVTQAVVPEDHAVTVRYEQNNAQREVRYWIDATSRLMRQETQNGVTTSQPMVENVTAFDLRYGVDRDEDGALDDTNLNGMLDDWVPAASAGSRAVAVNVTLTARPSPINPDVQVTSPRTLISSVTFRNLSLLR
jgi:prepilin-type N-terminal cleavage/methylation domain-containing protein